MEATQRKCYAGTEAETGITLLQTKDHLGLPDVGRCKKGSSCCRGNMARQHLDFGLLVPITARLCFCCSMSLVSWHCVIESLGNRHGYPSWSCLWPAWWVMVAPVGGMAEISFPEDETWCAAGASSFRDWTS